MIPKDIIERLGLIPTHILLGNSFVNGEKIYTLPNFPTLPGEEVLVMGCDEKGNTLPGNGIFNVLMVHKVQGMKVAITMKVTYEFARYTEPEILDLMVQRTLDGSTKVIEDHQGWGPGRVTSGNG